MRALLAVSLLASSVGATDLPESCVKIAKYIQELATNSKHVFDTFSVSNPGVLDELIVLRYDFLSEMKNCSRNDKVRRVLSDSLLRADIWLPRKLQEVIQYAPRYTLDDLGKLGTEIDNISSVVAMMDLDTANREKAALFISEMRRVVNDALARPIIPHRMTI
jgi:hypothetical protein